MAPQQHKLSAYRTLLYRRAAFCSKIMLNRSKTVYQGKLNKHITHSAQLMVMWLTQMSKCGAPGPAGAPARESESNIISDDSSLYHFIYTVYDSRQQKPAVRDVFGPRGCLSYVFMLNVVRSSVVGTNILAFIDMM